MSSTLKPNPIFSDNIVLDISGLLDKPIDTDKLIEEVRNAEQQHPYTKRSKVWLSIPLRSANGEIGQEASSAKGIWNTSDPNVFKDTPIMQPYIRSILDQMNAPILKVRILKLKSKKWIGEHVDNFQSKDIVRFHIPIVTHPLVQFWIDKQKYYIEPDKLSYLNVRKRHKVFNKSHIDRIHLVFDVKETPELIERIKSCCKIVNPIC
jgi:hypothetical protein